MISTRPTVAEIDLNSIGYNVRQFKHNSSDAELMAVIKADGYGHGAIEVAWEAIKNGATWLGVATAKEGIQLRRAGFKTPILVLGGITPEEIIDCSYNDIDVAVYGKNFIGQLDGYSNIFRKPLNIHLKIDTGMHRIGVLPEDLDAFVKELGNRKYINTRGIFTHFPNAAGDEEFSNQQLAEFADCVNLTEKVLGEIPYKHTANSAAAVNLIGSHFNLVRVGLGLYGYHDEIWLGEKLEIRPALTWKTKVTSTREIKLGNRVGYGRTYLVNRDSRIATIPIGYADGYKRILSNNGFVLIKGQRARIAGRVCMDQTMVDITDIPDVVEGDEVVLIGKQGDEKISMYEMCEWADTIPNDILVSIKERVDRTYIHKID